MQVCSAIIKYGRNWHKIVKEVPGLQKKETFWALWGTLRKKYERGEAVGVRGVEEAYQRWKEADKCPRQPTPVRNTLLKIKNSDDGEPVPIATDATVATVAKGDEDFDDTQSVEKDN